MKKLNSNKKKGRHMSKQNTKEKPVKKKLNRKQKFDKYVMPVMTFAIGLIALAAILGLAVKGLMGYLENLTEQQQMIVSVIGVSSLAYAVVSLVKLFDK